jgi:hypothetical protein
MYHIPEYIFDLAQHFSFTELSAAEQREVLAVMSAQEYNDIFLGSRLAATARPQALDIKGRKDAILEALPPAAFVLKEPLQYLRLWQAAAALFACLFVGTWLYYGHSQDLALSTSTTQVVHDTVQLAAREHARTIYDTIYITKKTDTRVSTKKAAAKVEDDDLSMQQQGARLPKLDNATMVKVEEEGQLVDSLSRLIGFNGVD